MGNKFFGLWAFAIILLTSVNSYSSAEEAYNIGANDFPDDFIFGAASAAYQVEGAAFEGGRGLSIWDVFSHIPGKIKDKSTGDVAVDNYNRYEEDMMRLKFMGMEAYRFSISWSRIYPNGGPRNGKLNMEGVDFYNRVIDAALNNSLVPYATLFHWDTPAILEYEYGGFRNESIIEDFKAYTNTCFALFGDRVKHWITLNEPWIFSMYGYDLGIHAPGRCSPCLDPLRCLDGNSAVEPYTVAHNLLLAHAAAAEIYKKNHQEAQNGTIGITLLSEGFLPFNSSNENDTAAAERMLDFTLGWFLVPLRTGDYPPVMREYVGDRLPRFTESQSEQLRRSADFVGINYYTTEYAADDPNRCNDSYSCVMRYSTDRGATLSFVNASGHQIGPKSSGVDWLYVYPPGIAQTLAYATQKSNNMTIYVTENGYPGPNDLSAPAIPSDYDYDCGSGEQILPMLNDTERVTYYQGHLHYVREAIRAGSDIKGYFGWTLTDNFEWQDGFSARFGLYYIDFRNNLNRHRKLSTCWFKEFNSLRKRKPSLMKAIPEFNSNRKLKPSFMRGILSARVQEI